MSDSMSHDAGFTSLVASVMSRAREEEEAPGTKKCALGIFRVQRQRHSTREASSAAPKAAAHHLCGDLQKVVSV